MLQAFEGFYRNGTIELLEFPDWILESRVLITFLVAPPASETPKSIQFGMFSGAQQSREADFELAQFQGNVDELEVQ